MPTSRRELLKNSFLGLVAASVPSFATANALQFDTFQDNKKPHPTYPAVHPDLVAEIVGVSHFNLDRLKELVEPRPELSKSNWDWGFGDRESAIGAASHVGRKDIVEYLMSRGATPTIFTYAMLGAFDAVKSMLVLNPELINTQGPHGISLLEHVEIGLARKASNPDQAKRLMEYLQNHEALNDTKYLLISEAEKLIYVGDYKYGQADDEGFTVKLNMRKMLSLGQLGKSGGSLLRLGKHEFTYGGAPSLRIKFDVKEGKAFALTVAEPQLILRAERI